MLLLLPLLLLVQSPVLFRHYLYKLLLVLPLLSLSLLVLPLLLLLHCITPAVPPFEQEFVAMMKDRVNRGLKSFSRQVTCQGSFFFFQCPFFNACWQIPHFFLISGGLVWLQALRQARSPRGSSSMKKNPKKKKNI